MLEQWLIWIFGIFAAVTIWSWLFRGDNQVFQFSETIFVAFAAGHFVNMSLSAIQNMAIEPILRAQWIYVIPVILGIASLTTLSEKYFWISRYPLAIIIGVSTGLSTRGLIRVDIVNQLNASIGNLSLIGIAEIIIMVCVISYFFFIYLKKVGTTLGTLGRYFMMIAFGALFGNGVVGGFSYLIQVLLEIFNYKLPF
jgi:hypothetical protein